MQNRFCCFVFLALLPWRVYAAQTEVQQYDSTMAIMKNRSVPIMDRYYMTGNIENLSRDHQVAVLKQLLPEAKMVEDKAVITRLYSIISMLEAQQEHLNIAKIYLDSAFVYDGKFENNTISGMLYYVAGLYYSNKIDMSQAHKHYYKSVQYFNKNVQKPGLLADIYYNLSTIYIYWQDAVGLGGLMQQMKDCPTDYPVQKIMKYSVEAQYYYIQYTNTRRKEFLDSAAVCNKQAFDIYEHTENPYDVGHQISETYFLQSLIDCEQGNMSEAKRFFDIAKKLANPNKMSVNAQLLFVSGVIEYHMGNYEQAEQELNKVLGLLARLEKEQQVSFYHLLCYSYSVLAKIYESQQFYKKSLEAERIALSYQSLFFKQSGNKDIIKFRIEYDLNTKEQRIEQLTVLNEQSRRINQLAVVVVTLAFGLIFMLVVRYRVRQKQHSQLLEITRLKQLETDLVVELQQTKLEEKEQEFQTMVNETQQRRVQSYLEGLEAEQNRLAKELHDNVSNELLAIKMKIEEESSTTAEVLRHLQSLHAEVRGISHDLMPPAFSYATLPEILQDYVTQRNKAGRTSLSLSIQPEMDWEQFPQKDGLEIYRIVQEATGNALKYAEASEIVITLVWKDNQITVMIADDGRGFDLSKKSKGIGLTIIRERVEHLHGHLIVDTAPGKGTKISLEMDGVRPNTWTN